MPTFKRSYPARTNGAHYKTFEGSFVGINGASPTSFVGQDVTITRTGEGTWTLVPQDNVAALVSATVTCEENDNAYHEVLITSATVSSGTLTVTVRHRTVAYASITSGPTAEDVVDRIHFRITVALSDVPGAGV